MSNELKKCGELEERGYVHGPSPEPKRIWHPDVGIVPSVDQNVHVDGHPSGPLKESQYGNDLASCLEAAATAALFQDGRHL